MARVHNEKTLNNIKVARLLEKSAREEAKRRLEFLVDREVAEVHEKLLETVRVAVLEGHSIRQIGFAYGSSDPHTARRIIAEACADLQMEDGTEGMRKWRVFANENDTFDVQVYSIGESEQSGRATFTIDEDGNNITAIDGDLWVGIQLYRLGLVPEIVKEYNERGTE